MGKPYSLKGDAPYVVIIILLSIAFWGRIIFSGDSLYGSDFILQFYPWKKFIYDYMWNDGVIPFWNPYLFSGTPFIANIQASIFYPLGFLYYLFPPEIAYGYSMVLHSVLGCLFMYAFMRSLLISRAGCLTASIVFSFNGFFMGHLYAGHLSFVQNYIWIPLIFYFLYRFIQKLRLKYAVASGLTLGVQILGGFPQIAFYTILGCIGFGLFHGTAVLRNRNYPGVFKIGIGLFLLLFIGFALSAIQILPTLEFVGLSTRAGGVSYEFATYESLHPKEMISFLMPEIFGSAIDQTYWRSKETWHFWESCAYVGILPLLLVFIKIKDRHIRGVKLFFVMLIIISLFLALGKYNPFYHLIYRLPGFNSFRIPAQIIFLYVFGVAALCGIGLQGMQETNRRLSRGFFSFIILTGILLVSFMIGIHLFPYDFFFQLFRYFSEGPLNHANLEALYGRVTLSIDRAVILFFTSFLVLLLRMLRILNTKIFAVVASAIILTDLYLFGSQFIKTNEFITRPREKNIVAELRKNPKMGRVVTISDLFNPNDGLRYGFYSILGYDPLILKRYVYYTQSSQNYNYDDHVVNLSYINKPGAKLIKMLNVRQMVFGNHVKSLENVLPYANIVSKAVIRPADQVLSFMKSDKFDPRKMVVFEPEYGSHVFSVSQDEVFEASCTILDYDRENIRIRTSSNQPGYLVLSEIYYPGWHAILDGREISVLKGNYIFRVIPLEKGEHDIHLFFVCLPFRIGLFVSLLTLGGSLWFVLRRRKRSPTPKPL